MTLLKRFVAGCAGPDRPWKFYGLAVGLTAVAGMLVSVLHVAGAIALQQAYYIVILSTLLRHYHLDHLQFTKPGDMLGSGDRLLAGRADAMSIEPVEPEEVVDGVAVLDPPHGLAPERSRSALSPMLVQTATAAGVSMLAGATAVALMRHRKASRAARRRRRQIGPVLATRSFLIDVHMLGERK